MHLRKPQRGGSNGASGGVAEGWEGVNLSGEGNSWHHGCGGRGCGGLGSTDIRASAQWLGDTVAGHWAGALLARTNIAFRLEFRDQWVAGALALAAVGHQ